jgi:pimeloyl-ACP methyl ester carboxylesterase
MSLVPVARQLGDDFSLIAPDLRGRGASASLPGPFGMAAHAADCAAVLDHLGAGPVTVVGESMGGFVGVVLAARRPDLVDRLVLVDGGLPLPVPEGIDVDTMIDAVLGPAVARLRQTFESVEAYLDFWRVHPALQEDWSDDIEAYLRYDLTGEPPTLRSRVSEAAVRADGAENLVDPGLVPDALASLQCDVTMLRATRGLLNQVPPLYPDEVVEPWRAVVPRFADEVIDDTNHYTIAFGERGAKTVADHVRR